MITDEEIRWSHSQNKSLPKRKGVLKNLDKFDANFFGILQRQVQSMDPQGRVMLECAYEAILDAGLNPQELRNTRTGCFVALCFSEAEKSVFSDVATDGYGLPGFVTILNFI